MNEHLETYLQDHRAGATGALELARRVRDENRQTEYGAFFTDLARDSEEDVADLDTIMTRFNVSKDTMKSSFAWASEKVARLKPNEALSDYSPLSRVLECEALRSAITVKLCLWQALYEIGEGETRLDREDLKRLIKRAKDQLRGLEEQHLRAARDALAPA